jgi:hypothetical protein
MINPDQYPEKSSVNIFSLVEKYNVSIEEDPDIINSYRLTFPEQETTTTIRIGLKDESGADLIITNITTLPEDKQGLGYGSKAIKKLIEWSLENNLRDIRAVQVQEESEGFWIKNGFKKKDEPNPTNDFVFKR